MSLSSRRDQQQRSEELHLDQRKNGACREVKVDQSTRSERAERENLGSDTPT